MIQDGKIFVYIDFKIKDKEAFQEYSQGVPATMKLYGGRSIGVQLGANFVVGLKDVDVQVIQEWPSNQAFIAWQNSAEYAPLKLLRDTKALENLTMSIIKAL